MTIVAQFCGEGSASEDVGDPARKVWCETIAKIAEKGFFCLFSKSQMSGLVWTWACALLLCVSNASAWQVTLAWDAVSLPSLRGYRLYYGQQVGAYASHLDVGSQTTYSVSGLTDGQTYYFAVTAYNADKESALSDEVSVTPVTVIDTSTGNIIQPDATFSATPTSDPAPLPVAFTDASTDS